jgi:hypothetical protein
VRARSHARSHKRCWPARTWRGRAVTTARLRSKINAHIVLHVFLPALVFESAFSSHFHIFWVQIKEALVRPAASRRAIERGRHRVIAAIVALFGPDRAP